MKITIKETRKWRTLWGVVRLPDILDRMYDDVIYERLGRSALGMKLKVRSIIANRANHVFKVFLNHRFAGCFALVHLGAGDYEAHTLLLKDFNGLYAVRIGRFATRFVLDLPYVKKLVSFCPLNMPETFLFAKMCGWKSLGYLPGKWIKNGVSYSIKGVAVTKEDLCPA